jgi:hypothetical protein
MTIRLLGRFTTNTIMIVWTLFIGIWWYLALNVDPNHPSGTFETIFFMFFYLPLWSFVMVPVALLRMLCKA